MSNPNQKLIDVVKRLDSLTSGYKGSLQNTAQSQQQPQEQSPEQPQQQEEQPQQKYSTSINWSFPAMTEIDKFLAIFQEKGDTLAAHDKIPEITSVAIKIFGDMKKILEFTYRAKKPSEGVVKQIQEIITSKLAPLQRIQNEKSKYTIHAKAVQEQLNSVFWLFNYSMPYQFVEMTLESSEYTALKFKNEKVQEVNQWYNTLISASKELLKYIKSNFPTGPIFSFQGTTDYQELINALNRDTDILPQPVVQSQQQQQPQQVQQQNLGAQGPATSGAFKELFQLLSDSQASADQSGIEQLSTIVKTITEVFKKMDLIVREAKNFQGTPEVSDLQEIQKFLTKILDPLFVIKKDLQFKDVVMSFSEGTNAAFWVFMQGNPKEMIKSAIESSEFHALKLKAKKIPAQTESYNNFHKSLQFVLSHTLMNYPNGLKWGNPSGTLNKQKFIDLLKGAPQQPEQQQPPQLQSLIPQQNVPSLGPGGPGGPPSLGLLLQQNPNVLAEHGQPQTQGVDNKQALFNSLNVGMDGIKKHLRHVDKKQLELEKLERAQKLQEKLQQKQKEMSAQKASGQKKEKPPKKSFKDNWYFENFKGEQLGFEEHEEVAPKMSIFVDNCKESSFQVNKKCNQIFVNNCNKVTIIFSQLVSGVVAMNCKNVTIICQDFCPSISIDKCQETQIRLNKNLETDVITSQCAETNVTWMETDEPAKDTPVPEQFITRWDNQQKKFITKLLEQEW